MDFAVSFELKENGELDVGLRVGEMHGLFGAVAEFMADEVANKITEKSNEIKKAEDLLPIAIDTIKELSHDVKQVFGKLEVKDNSLHIDGKKIEDKEESRSAHVSALNAIVGAVLDKENNDEVLAHITNAICKKTVTKAAEKIKDKVPENVKEVLKVASELDDSSNSVDKIAEFLVK